MNLTRKQKSNLKWLSNQFNNYEETKKTRKYIDKDIRRMSLEELYNYNCYYAKDEDNKDIYINVSKIPLKGGKFKYGLIGYDLVEYMNRKK